MGYQIELDYPRNCSLSWPIGQSDWPIGQSLLRSFHLPVENLLHGPIRLYLREIPLRLSSKL